MHDKIAIDLNRQTEARKHVLFHDDEHRHAAIVDKCLLDRNQRLR